MKRIVVALIVGSLIAIPAMAEEMMHGRMSGMHAHQSGMTEENDTRTSLNLPTPMRLIQKKMMREHLQAVNDIVGLIAERKFNAASKIAHRKLGLTPEMKKMCNMFANDHFRKIGLDFHKHADELGDVLKMKNLNKSLRALHTVMNSCVQCHATFRQ